MTDPMLHPSRPRSLSSDSDSSSTDASDDRPVRRTNTNTNISAFLAQPSSTVSSAMDARVAFSQSSPNLGQQLDGAANASETVRDTASRHSSRTHSHSAVPPHFDAYRGQTWVDFLRDAGADQNTNAQRSAHPLPNLHAPLPPLPPDLAHDRIPPHYSFPARSSSHLAAQPSPSSSERKRRLTTADSPFRRPSSIRMHSENHSGSSSNPVVLTSSPAAPSAPRPSLSSHPSTTRRDSDFALPRWQPDSEVTHCFVCGSHFTFFYRKHHCRKCGRVVCSACSPHRITIPRQYIVHPPQDNPYIIDLTSDDDDHHMSRYGPFGNPALGGGEEVRVCNPCVPDPNFSPPPQQHGQQNTPFPAFSPTPHSPHLPPSNIRPSHRSTQSVNDTSRPPQTPRPHDPFTDRRTSYHGASRVADLWPPPQPPSNYGHGQPPAYDPRSRPHSHSLLASPLDPTMPSSRRSFFSHRPPAPVPAPPPPRRQIPEEDECPVCGAEMPPIGPSGDDAARTQHVQDCIALHSGSPPGSSVPAPSNTSTSLPSQRTRGMSGAAGSGPSRLSLSMRGLVPYVATEKDCVDDEGNEAECVICFEEFGAGDKMARLVCWCKFHEACIREWWEKKGRGACPTHQLQY